MPFVEKLGRLLVRVFGSANERALRPMLHIAEEVSRLEPEMQSLSDSQLGAKTAEFRDRLNDRLKGRTDFTREEADAVLEPLIPEAFATVREASQRTVTTSSSRDPQPMRHFDVQLVGGLVLHRGCIAEMVTGEGKTLVATLPAYLNALLGKGVHIVTVNDFLAKRDRDWMAPLFEFLGMTTGAIQSDQDYPEKRAAYRCDVTYGYDSEFGFDYLRDNMRWSAEEQVQLGRMFYAIVDEVDSVLIDEARTPLIISGPAEENTDKYYRANGVARKLKRGVHFEVKEKEETCHLTEAGVAAVERQLGVDSIYSGRNTDWPHHIEQALRAHNLYKRDVKYVVREGEILIVDEFTGRLMSGRRWSDGLHQAIEAKEGLHIKEENQTLATITYQNFFRLYQKLAGMTGTALTEATEFDKIYKLGVNVVPTNRPLIRHENPDVVLGTPKEKWDAVEEEIVRQHATGRPLLVGTISIENSEMISSRLQRRGIKHDVLNAKHHEREAQIVAHAGELGRVTIATNMAGRGTDIVLGDFAVEDLLEHWKACELAPPDLRADMPREELERKLNEFWACVYLDEDEQERVPRERWRTALERRWPELRMAPLRLCRNVAGLGGLHIVGTERHEARRIDNQLRGRAGRQGDPGSSRFYVSLEDDLMRIFAGDLIKSIWRRAGITDGVALEYRMVSRAIERAQRKVEQYHFEMRKHVLDYDEIPNEQRKAIYGLRQRALEQEDVREILLEMIAEVLRDDVDAAVVTDAPPEARSARPLCDWAREYEVDLRDDDWAGRTRDAVRETFVGRALEAWAGRSREDLARAAVESILRIAFDEDLPFCRWDFSLAARWARRLRLRAEAADMRGWITEALEERFIEGAQRRFGEAPLERVLEPMIEYALDVYLPLGAIAAEDWNLRGLQAWGEAIGVRVPIGQWQRVEAAEEGEEEAGERDRRKEVRQWLLDRLPTQLKKREPFSVLKAAIRHETRRLLELIGREEEETYRPLLTPLDGAFDLNVAESDIRRIAQQQRGRIAADLAKQYVEANVEVEDDAYARAVFAGMFDSFLTYDLSNPERDFATLAETVARRFDIEVAPFDLSQRLVEELPDHLMERVGARYEERAQELGVEAMRNIERHLLLQMIDSKWKDHLYNMDHLREGIGMRAYAQVDPKIEYTREARRMFQEMMDSIGSDVADLILRVEPAPDEGSREDEFWGGGEAIHSSDVALPDDGTRQQQESAIDGTRQAGEKPKPVRVTSRAPGRNDPCPCGSGKKFKKCCGKAG